jgi:hypothetical protein
MNGGAVYQQAICTPATSLGSSIMISSTSRETRLLFPADHLRATVNSKKAEATVIRKRPQSDFA